MKPLIVSQVRDIDFETDLHHYDAGFFVSGYESRSTYISKKLPSDMFDKFFVLYPREHQESKVRQRNNKHYSKIKHAKIVHLGEDDYRTISTLLNDLAIAISTNGIDTLRLFIDYSSMTSIWYSAVLLWCEYQARIDNVILDCAYSPGIHPVKHQSMVISSVKTVMGFEGRAHDRTPHVVLFGLGFEGAATSCVADILEPTDIYSLCAYPGASANDFNRCRKENEYLISLSNSIIKLPVTSVETTYSGISDFLHPLVGSSKITIVPMGPKSHVMAIFLAGLYYRNVSILRVSGRSTKMENIKPRGEIIATRVTFERRVADNQSDGSP